MKVLVGVDGSAGGFAAVRLAGRLVDPAGDKIVLYYTPPEIHSREADAEICERAGRRWPTRSLPRHDRTCPRPWSRA